MTSVTGLCSLGSEGKCILYKRLYIPIIKHILLSEVGRFFPRHIRYFQIYLQYFNGIFYLKFIDDEMGAKLLYS